MTNFEKIQEMDEIGLSFLLAYFADHQLHCSDKESNLNSECIGCPIAEDGCCGMPKDPCNVSAFRWLLQEYTGDNDCFQIEHSDVNPCDFCSKATACANKHLNPWSVECMCKDFENPMESIKVEA